MIEPLELQPFLADITVHEEQVLLKDGLTIAYRVYCPRCKVSISSVTSAAVALNSLKDHLRVSHKLNATLTRREVAPIV